MVQEDYSEPDSPAFDEGWWASVLAEEESRTGAAAPKPNKPEERVKPPLNWEKATALFRKDEIVCLRVTGFNRGGLLVEGSDLSGFVPTSHLVGVPSQEGEESRESNLAAYVGENLRLKIIECVPAEGRMVFSERAARSEAGKRPALFSALQPGQHVTGEITNVTEFGAFVDLGGVEGLIHISELSWGRVAHPNQIVRVGDHVEVLVLEVAPERCRIALSLKRLSANPWETVAARYPVNSITTAVITALVPYGAFARLEEGLEGLIHTSEIPEPADANAKPVLATGQSVQVRVLQVDVARQRLGLSMRLHE
jgi:small subunit ribosomal protein S1